ncbi:MAG: ATP-binding protein [Bacteroidota bacterium]
MQNVTPHEPVLLSDAQREKQLFRQAITAELARSIAHEIKNPLSAINFSLYELRAVLERPAQDNDNPAEFLDIIEKCGKKINTALEELLRATSPRPLQPAPVGLKTLAEEALFFVQARILEKNISTVLQVPSDILVRADKAQLMIALMSLLHNAIDSISAPEGSIRVTGSAGNGVVRLDIQDNGKGIQERDIDRIFEPFYSTRSEAAGLGLTTAQTIITQHRGLIRVESVYGKGSVFSVLLPHPH